MIKLISYIFIWIYLCNPIIVFFVGNLLVHSGNDVVLMLLSIPILVLYSKYVWMPVRRKYKKLDDAYIKFLEAK